MGRTPKCRERMDTLERPTVLLHSLHLDNCSGNSVAAPDAVLPRQPLPALLSVAAPGATLPPPSLESYLPASDRQGRWKCKRIVGNNPSPAVVLHPWSRVLRGTCTSRQLLLRCSRLLLLAQLYLLRPWSRTFLLPCRSQVQWRKCKGIVGPLPFVLNSRH
jgi:hypothetical protein